MRKITSLLMLFCMCVGMAFAQTLPATNKAFKVENNRGALAINNDGTALIGTPNVAIADVAQKNFAFVQHDGKVYLYSVWASKFVNKDCSLTNSLPVDAITVENVADGKFFFKFDDAHNVNLGGSGQIAVNDWGKKDAGNQFTLVENGDFDPTAALAILDNSCTITYNFKYNGNVVATQVTKINKGANYPAFTSLPWGAVATVPTGTADADETVEIVCTVDVSVLPFVPAKDYNSIEYWYYLNIGDDAYYLYHTADATHIALNKKAVDESAKDAYSWAFIGNPWDGFSIVNKAAGATMVLSSPVVPNENTNADQVARMVVKHGAAGNLVWTIMNPTHNNAPAGSFYVQHPTATNWAINRQGFNGGNALCYWNNRDTGSSFQIVERQMGALADLEDLLTDANALLTTVNDNIGTEIGEYTQATADALTAAITTADALVELQKQWKAIGPVARKYSDDLWKMFTTACDTFFEAKRVATKEAREVFAQKRAEAKERWAKKVDQMTDRQKLIKMYENLVQEIKTAENNILFFTGKSKSGNKIVDDMRKKIDTLKAQLADLENKINQMDAE